MTLITQQQINSFLLLQDCCKFMTEIVQVLPDKTEKKINFCLIQHKTSPNEYMLMIIHENFKKTSTTTKNKVLLTTLGQNILVSQIFCLKNNVVVKITDESQFDLLFKDQATVISFKSSSISQMSNVLTTLTKIVNNYEKSIDPKNKNKETHSWCNYYISIWKKNNKLVSLDVISPSKREKFFKSPQILSGGSVNSSNTSTKYYTSSKSNNNSNPNSTNSMSASDKRRNIWIQNQMKTKEDQFTKKEDISIVIGTWNVNSKIENNESLSKWLRLDKFKADIYAIGMQEIDMSASALMREETEVSSQWTSLLEKTFNKCGENYIMVAKRQLVGVFNIIFIKSKYKKYLRDVMTLSISVGLMGLLGNKGGVGIRFKIFETSFCFVTSHLAAHHGEIEKRNQNFHDISRKMLFGGNPNLSIPKHDYVFWYGDLNYRINLIYDAVLAKIKKGDLKFLLEHDQLSNERKAKRVFNSFLEGKIDFNPTYKFDSGKDIYDTSEKKRIPSYTDRILWKKPLNRYPLKQNFYEMDMIYKISDHKPVVSGFNGCLKTVIKKKYKEIYKKLIKELDKRENDMRPEIQADTKNFDFSDLIVGVTETRKMTLKNVGQVVCEFKILAEPPTFGTESKNMNINDMNNDNNDSENDFNESAFKNVPDWLQITPNEGIFMPGETMEIKFNITITKKLAKLINSKRCFTKEHFVILHLESGGDHFISLHVSFKKSCLGNSIKRLVYIPGPVRTSEYPISSNSIGSNFDNFEKWAIDKNIKKQKIPKEIWRMVDFLFKNGLKDSTLFKETGNSNEVKQIFQQLDQGIIFDPKPKVNSMAQALMQFLEQLEEPLIPFKFYKLCTEVSSNPSTCLEIVSKILEEHLISFYYIMSFLREVARTNKNITTAELAIIFSKVILIPPPQNQKDNNLDVSEQRARVQFLKLFLRPDIVWYLPSLQGKSGKNSVKINEKKKKVVIPINE